jgi:hypothetical protein
MASYHELLVLNVNQCRRQLVSATNFSLKKAKKSHLSLISLPDEGVEDVLLEPIRHDLMKTKSLSSAVSLKYIDSASSTTSSPLHEYYSFKDNVSSCASSRDVSPHTRYTSHRSRSENRLRETCIHLEPPRVVINDQSQTKSIYTSSPIRKSSTTEVFSQKYRVSSFEDMSLMSGKTNLKLLSAKGGRKVCMTGSLANKISSRRHEKIFAIGFYFLEHIFNKKWALLKSLCRPSARLSVCPSVTFFSGGIASRELKF